MLEQGKVSFGIYTDGLKVHYIDPLVDCDDPIGSKNEQSLPVRGIFVPFAGATLGLEYRPCAVLNSVVQGIINSPEEKSALPETHKGLFTRVRKELGARIRELNDPKLVKQVKVYQEEY